MQLQLLYMTDKMERVFVTHPVETTNAKRYEVNIGSW